MKKNIVLRIPLREAENSLNVMIQTGRSLYETPIDNINTWKRIEKKYNDWNSINYEKLTKLFNDKKIAKEYSSASWRVGQIFISGHLLKEKTEKLKSNINNKIEKLSAIKTGLDIFSSESSNIQTTKKNKVFFVYGSNCEIKSEVLKYLRAIDLEPIILNELAEAGKTIIDMIQDQDEVKYAIVLLTPDNVAGKYSEKANFHATQNVILELGIFIGLFGRKNVYALAEEEVELPADYHGFEYIMISDTNSWKNKLSEELDKTELKSP